MKRPFAINIAIFAVVFSLGLTVWSNETTAQVRTDRPVKASPQGMNVPEGGCALAANRVTNGDAEGNPEADGDGEDIDVAGWENETGGFTAIRYDTTSRTMPAPEFSPPDRGDFLLSGNDPVASATQLISVTDCISEIDSGELVYSFQAYLGGITNQPDNARVTAEFLDGSDGVLASVTIGPVTNTDRGGVTSLLLRLSNGYVPVGTRSVRLTILLSEVTGVNNGYVDNLTFRLFSPTAAPVSVGGRILNSNGSAIRGAVIELIEEDGTPHRATSNGFGYYTFSQIDVGQNVMLYVSSKQYLFPGSPRSVLLTDELTDMTFIGHR